jgi:hypothetical protein
LQISIGGKITMEYVQETGDQLDLKIEDAQKKAAELQVIRQKNNDLSAKFLAELNNVPKDRNTLLLLMLHGMNDFKRHEDAIASQLNFTALEGLSEVQNAILRKVDEMIREIHQIKGRVENIEKGLQDQALKSPLTEAANGV